MSSATKSDSTTQIIILAHITNTINMIIVQIGHPNTDHKEFYLLEG